MNSKIFPLPWHLIVIALIRGFGTKQDFIPFFFSMYADILWQNQICSYNESIFLFVDIFHSKFQLVVSTFFICSEFCVENWLFCSVWRKLHQVSNMSGLDVRGFGNGLFKYKTSQWILILCLWVKHEHSWLVMSSYTKMHIWCLNEVSTMFYICIYCIFTSWGRHSEC